MSVSAMQPTVAISTNERATPSLVYRSLLRAIREGLLVPGAKLPNERDLAQQLNTSRTAVRAALAMMERQGLVRRRVGSGTFLTEDARDIFVRMDQTDAARHEAIPSFPEIIEGRLLFEPAMINRVQEHEIDQMRRILGEILDAHPGKTSRRLSTGSTARCSRRRGTNSSSRSWLRSSTIGARCSSTGATLTGPRPCRCGNRPTRSSAQSSMRSPCATASVLSSWFLTT
jgi:DNA-binding FadR family transcriptional regulator